MVFPLIVNGKESEVSHLLQVSIAKPFRTGNKHSKLPWITLQGTPSIMKKHTMPLSNLQMNKALNYTK